MTVALRRTTRKAAAGQAGDGLPSMVLPAGSSDRGEKVVLALRAALALEAGDVLLDPVGATLARLRTVGAPAPGDECETHTKSDAVGEADAPDGGPVLLGLLGRMFMDERGQGGSSLLAPGRVTAGRTYCRGYAAIR